jgi:hypothetical protein
MDHRTAAQSGTPTTIEWNNVGGPGAYITEEGVLVRFQEGALKQGHSPLITVLSRQSTKLTKISSDPFIPVGKARLLAADADLPVNF